MVIVIGWQVYDIARETMGLKEAALRLGIIGLVQFVPLFLLTLVTGWTADRVDRRWIARGSVALELGCAVALAWFAWRGTTTLLALYAVAALLGVARAFAGPALGALAPNLVPREILPRAIALSSIAWQSGRDPRARARRLSLRLRAVRALCGAARACSRFRSPACSRSARSRGPNIARGPKPVGADGRGAALRPPQPARARRDQPRPVRGAARRSDGDAAGVRARRASRRARGPRPSARRAGRRRDADRRLLLDPAAEAQCRRQDAGRGRRVRRGDDRLRLLALDAAVARLPRRCSAPPTCSRSMSASR